MQSFLVLLCTAFVTASAAQAQESLAFKEVNIPRDELRQQRISNVREFRCSYKLPLNAGDTVVFVVETFRDGRQDGRYCTGGSAPSVAHTAEGFVSLAWRPEKREMVILDDDGTRYSPWTTRIQIPENGFDAPTDAFYFADSPPVHRETSQPGHDVTLFPVLGICGIRPVQIAYNDTIKTSDAFVDRCTHAGAHCAVVVYLCITKGGRPDLTWTD